MATQEQYDTLTKENETLKQEIEDLNFVLEAMSEALLISDDPSKLYERIITKPQLCILLNEELTTNQIFELAQALNLVQVEHEGQQRFATLLSVHKLDPDKESEIIAILED